MKKENDLRNQDTKAVRPRLMSESEQQQEYNEKSKQTEEITPAQCFINDIALTTITMPRSNLEGSKSRKEFVVTSNRDMFPLDDSTLMQKGFYSDRHPRNLKRWSLQSVRDFKARGISIITIRSVYEKILQQFRTYIDFGDPRQHQLMAIWVIGTYFHRMFDSFPYIRVYGNFASGKTKTSQLAMEMAFNGELTATSSASYTVRSIHDNNSSCGIDEVEKLGRDSDSQTLISVYNSGYKKGAFVGKSEVTKDGGWNPKHFDAYAPKIFSGIKGLAPTLASRCIPIVMIRSQDKELMNREIKAKDPRFQEIRDDLYILMMTHFKDVQGSYDTISDKEILGREWELWKPILSLSLLIDMDLFRDMRSMAIESQKEKREELNDEIPTPKILKLLKIHIEGNRTGDDYYPIESVIDDTFLNADINPYYEDFKWLETSKAKSRWLGDEMRKIGLLRGATVQKKIGMKNRRCVRLKLEDIEKKSKIFNDEQPDTADTSLPITRLTDTEIVARISNDKFDKLPISKDAEESINDLFSEDEE